MSKYRKQVIECTVLLNKVSETRTLDAETQSCINRNLIYAEANGLVHEFVSVIELRKHRAEVSKDTRLKFEAETNYR